jgi:hypothetical protein
MRRLPEATLLKNPRWLARRAEDSLRARTHAFRVRLQERGLFDLPTPSGHPTSILPWSSLATPPGHGPALPGRDRENGGPAAVARAAREHRFTVLCPGPVRVHAEDPVRKNHLEKLAQGLPEAVTAAYHLIDWHVDFHSGYRWNPMELHVDVRVAPAAGVDIKTPRELSRFQHVGALASGPLEQGGTEFLLQVLDWIAANPYRRGVNWASTMDVALRAVSWIWGLRLFERVLLNYPDSLVHVARSLHEHGVHIEHNLEYYASCTGNHYLSNIAGLVYIGAACPAFPESDRWLLFGLQELVSEMERTVYADGYAHEGSTHYHRLVAELFLSCAALAERVPAARRARLGAVNRRAHRVRPRLRRPEEAGLNLGAKGSLLPAEFYARLARMAELTAWLTKPNGLVPQFGDNDSGRAHKLLGSVAADVRDHTHVMAVAGQLLGRPDLLEAGIAARAEAMLVAGGLEGVIDTPAPRSALGGSQMHFPDAGIAVARRGPAWLAVTCGPNGQMGQGGHNHNDKLSFELNVHGLDFIVDGGCPVYTANLARRNCYRSTAAHSTIVVTGREQDQWPEGMRGAFRLPERSNPSLRISGAGSIHGEHHGFGRAHERSFELTAAQLEIFDHLDHDGERFLRFNFDPAVSIEGLGLDGDAVTCELVHEGGVRLSLSSHGVTNPTVGEGVFSIGYGVPTATQSLALKLPGPSARTVIAWDR